MDIFNVTQWGKYVAVSLGVAEGTGVEGTYGIRRGNNAFPGDINVVEWRQDTKSDDTHADHYKRIAVSLDSEKFRIALVIPQSFDKSLGDWLIDQVMVVDLQVLAEDKNPLTNVLLSWIGQPVILAKVLPIYADMIAKRAKVQEANAIQERLTELLVANAFIVDHSE